jgi:hypothetical protein
MYVGAMNTTHRTQVLTAPNDSAQGCERALYAFLAEKERRSGSLRTVQGHSRMLQAFFGTLGKTPDEVTAQDVFAFGHGIGPSGKKPSAVTIGARIALPGLLFVCAERGFSLFTDPAATSGLPEDLIQHFVDLSVDVSCRPAERLRSQRPTHQHSGEPAEHSEGCCGVEVSSMRSQFAVETYRP